LWKFDFELLRPFAAAVVKLLTFKLILIKDVMRGTMNVFLNERFSGDRQEEEERESERAMDEIASVSQVHGNARSVDRARMYMTLIRFRKRFVDVR